MTDYYRKIVNTILISGASDKTQRQTVYEKARDQAKRQIGRIDNKAAAEKLKNDLESAIAKAEERFAAEEAEALAKERAKQRAEQLAKLKVLGKKASLLLLLLIPVICVTWYLAKNPDVVRSIQSLVIPVASDNSQHSDKAPVQVSIQRDKKSDDTNLPPLPTDYSPTDTVMSIPQGSKPVNKKQKIKPAPIRKNNFKATDTNYIGYDKIKKCADGYLQIDREWKSLELMDGILEKKLNEIDTLEANQAPQLAVASSRRQYNNMVTNYNEIVDRLNTENQRLNKQCSNKNINLRDLKKICRQGSLYQNTEFCVSMMKGIN